MSLLSKAFKSANFDSGNSLKLSFANIRGLRSNFVDSESFLESNSPDILALCEKNLDDWTDSGNFSVRDYLPLIRKDSSIFHGRISISLVFLELLVNFVRGFRLELMYISLIENTRSSFAHVHGFQLLVLLS